MAFTPLGPNFPSKSKVVTGITTAMGIKERKERERQARSNEILEAARTLFEQRGFMNTTLQDVAKEAEISVGLIYRYFESKEDVFASLALKGAQAFDLEIEAVLKRALNSRKKSAAATLHEIAESFFKFYKPYGEYFDLLMFSVKGQKDVKVHSNTVTLLMSVTLQSLERLKSFVLASSEFKAADEEEALQVVFLLWGILLGCQKLFDSTGRGHLFTFGHDDFLQHLISQVLAGIGTKSTESSSRGKRHVSASSSARSQRFARHPS